eukprot:5475785-Amphidinium_carterae.1
MEVQSTIIVNAIYSTEANASTPNAKNDVTANFNTSMKDPSPKIRKSGPGNAIATKIFTIAIPKKSKM